MLTLKQLVVLSKPPNLNKYKPVSLTEKESKTSDGKKFTHYQAALAGGSKKQVCEIKLFGEDVESPALVRCNCNFFTFNLEVALASSGNCRLAKSTGAFPVKRNPRLRPALCPHLMLLALFVSSKDTARSWLAKREQGPQTAAVKIHPDLLGGSK